MRTPLILLLGHTGQVGFELQRCLSVWGDLLCPERQLLDLCDTAAVYSYLYKHQPDIIVNAAAWTAVDQSEQQQQQCDQLNHLLPQTLASYANQTNSWLLHYSSDYVYSGNGQTPWLETDVTAPVNYYGQSKLHGDNAIQQLCSKHIILRTSWVYSARGKNFMLTMLRLFQQKESLQIINDQWGAPTSARLIAQVSTAIIGHIVTNKNADQVAGVYHLASSGETNWHQYAVHIFEWAKRHNLTVSLQQLNAVPTSCYPTIAKRPSNSRLNCDKLVRTFNLRLPCWQEQVDITLAEWLDAMEKKNEA